MTTKKKTIAAAKKKSKVSETKATVTKKIVKRAVRAAKPTPPKHAESTSGPAAKLIAKVDVGWGNVLFARGEGAGLSWSSGIPLSNIDNETWVFDSSQETEEVVLKLLINDQQWAEGDNLNLSQGKTIIVKPKFERA